jgi:NitT/TauT family transport system permease protein
MLTGRAKYLVEFEFPNALPHILVGMKIAMTYSVVGAVVAEFISSNDGLGNLLLVANGALDSGYAIAALIALSAMGLVLSAGVSIVERLLIPWHVSQRRQRQSLDA